MTDQDRAFDLVLFGATGFTGGLTAEYLAGHVPDGCRWALAGRNPASSRRSGAGSPRSTPRSRDLPLLTADASDPASLRAVAEQARVVVTTVGPYVEHGQALVAACAEAGTDYADLTGEPEFVDTTYVAHHARAVETGARDSCTPAASTRSRTTSGRCSRCQQLPEGVPITDARDAPHQRRPPPVARSPRP